MTYNTLVVLGGAGLLGILCGVVGSFAVLRGRALLGDAVAHAALPGIGLAFLLFGTKSLPALLAGGLATGVAGVAFIAFARRRTRTREDAALGLVLSVFFGGGIALSRHIQNEVRDGSKAGLDTFLLGKTAGIVLADVWLIAAVAVLGVVVVALFFRAIRLVSFDADFARTLGWRTAPIDFGIMALLTLAVMVALPMVGVVMAAALTILPAVAARFWTSRLTIMLLLAGIIGLSGAAIGVAVSASQPKAPTGPTIILVTGGLFVLSALFAPHRGWLSETLRRQQFRRERTLLLLLDDLSGGARPLPELRRRLKELRAPSAGAMLRRAAAAGWIHLESGRAALTPQGAERLAQGGAP